MPLERAELQRLIAAQGYLELGMARDANDEIERVDPLCRHLPEVLAVRVEIYRALENWELMETVAKRLAEQDPETAGWSLSWAYAVRRAQSLEKAREILLAAAKAHPKDALIHFNLGCYAAQLGDLAEAKKRVKKAISLDGKLRATALDDPDLEPLWGSLESDWTG